MKQNELKQMALKELALFLVLLFFGFVVVPVAIYFVGQNVLGDFGGHGYGDFFGDLSSKIRSGDSTAWFFVLSPYLIWQILRLTLHAWHTVAIQKN